MKSICVITGTRAEYGLLRPLLLKLKNSGIDLRIAVTGAHLRQEYGYTVREIEQDGFDIHFKADIIEGNMIQSFAAAGVAFDGYFSRNNCDMVVVLGDRYEIFAASIAAAAAKVKIAHIHGGELTYGAIDDMFRHSITKMSHVHFAACETYRKRIIQMGENPTDVYNVGALGVENIKTVNLLDKKKLAEEIGMDLSEKYCVATFHPVTLSDLPANESQLENMLTVLRNSGINVIFTGANADDGGGLINKRLTGLCENNKKWRFYNSLGVVKYLSALKYCDFTIGNSSSGILEAPAFNVPSVNIGDRQRGRICHDSVINCDTDVNSIESAVEKALSDEFKKSIVNQHQLFGYGGTSDKITNILLKEAEKPYWIKEFYDF